MITIDFETKSEADLLKVGGWVYSQHPSTEIICACWGIDDEPIEEWWPGKPGEYVHGGMPKSLYMAMMLGHIVEAHNVAFERAIWTNVLAPRFGWRLPCDHQWRDTMATAMYYAMPAALDKLARAAGFQGKDPEGGRLITKYSKLNLKTAKREIPPEDFKKFVAYCRRDVQTEQSMSDWLGDLPDREVPYFLFDQRMNLRGLKLDIAGIDVAAMIVDQRSEELEAEFRALTGLGPGQTAKVKDWFAEQGVDLPNLQAETVEDTLKHDTALRAAKAEGGMSWVEPMSATARRAIEIRLAINKASTKKLDAMARNMGDDGRARYQTRYHGAQTGRNTGSGFQPLNLVRSWEDVKPDQLVRDIMYGNAKYLDAIYGDAMEAISKAGRHWIMAEDGNRILAGDFVSVEAVINACLAGEEWKVNAFRNKEKIYERMADKIYNFAPGTVTKATHPMERQDGKTGELAFGYQGALGAWLKFDNSGRHSDERIIEICKAWRAEHPMIVALWKGLQAASIEAVATPGKTTGYREIGFQVVDEWLSMILPNGKRIWYFDPQLRSAMPKWHNPAKEEACKDGSCGHRPQAQLTYMAQKEGQWKRVTTYGGKLTENACQATSREILMPAALRAEKAGYAPILTVYDEVVAEVPKGFGSKHEFEDIMRGPAEDWYADWPINVDAWEGDRYKK